MPASSRLTRPRPTASHAPNRACHTASVPTWPNRSLPALLPNAFAPDQAAPCVACLSSSRRAAPDPTQPRLPHLNSPRPTRPSHANTGPHRACHAAPCLALTRSLRATPAVPGFCNTHLHHFMSGPPKPCLPDLFTRGQSKPHLTFSHRTLPGHACLDAPSRAPPNRVLPCLTSPASPHAAANSSRVCATVESSNSNFWTMPGLCRSRPSATLRPR